MEHHEIRPDCERRIGTIEDRLDNLDELLANDGRNIAVLQTEVCHLVQSVDKLTKGIWGMVGTVLTLFLGLIVSRIFG